MSEAASGPPVPPGSGPPVPPGSGPPVPPGSGSLQPPGSGPPGRPVPPGTGAPVSPGGTGPAWPGATEPGWPCADEDILASEDLAELDGDLDPADFDPEYLDYAGYPDPDPDNGPPDGEEAWLAQLPSPVLAEYLTGPAAKPEALAAGFTHAEGGESCLGFRAGGAADQMLPGAVLARLTGQAWQGGLDAMPDDELVGVALAARRNASWQAALELAAVTELAARRRRAARANSDTRACEHFSQEIAAAFTLTGRGADGVLALAEGLDRLPQAAALLAAGVIDRTRAVVITDELACLDTPLARLAAERVLPGAGGLTTGQLRAALRRAVLAADPQAAIRRRKEAERDARVEAWVETAGTAALAGRDLPPAGVVAADRYIDAAARWLRDQGAAGTLPRLRAAVFVALLTGRAPATLLTGQAPAALLTGQAPAALLSPPAGTTQADKADAAGQGPVPSAGVAAWACTAVGPGGLSGLPGLVHLTMPLAAWAGRSEVPGEVAGLGPLDAGSCRELGAALAAHPASRWCLTLTDARGRARAHACARAGPGPPGAESPETGIGRWLAGLKISYLETGSCGHRRESTGYRPGAVLRHLVKVRSPACGYPGCRRRAVRCDDDHTIPYQRGGRTCECNLHPMCRSHHRAKQSPGWHLEQPVPGVLRWTLPHGRSYTVTPDSYPV